MSSLDDLQARIDVWHRANFGELSDIFVITKLTEEVGEAAHAAVRMYHGLQGKSVDPESVMHLRDALGDIVFVLMNLANNHGWSLDNIIHEVADEGLARDYTKKA